MEKKMKLSIVIPCYDEEKVLPLTLEQLNDISISLKVIKHDVLLLFTCVRPKLALKKNHWAAVQGAFMLAITDCQMILWTNEDIVQ